MQGVWTTTSCQSHLWIPCKQCDHSLFFHNATSKICNRGYLAVQNLKPTMLPHSGQPCTILSQKGECLVDLDMGWIFVCLKIVKCSLFPPRCYSLQNIEIPLLTAPLVVICEPVSRCLPTSWFSKLCLHFKNWISSQPSYRFGQFSCCWHKI